jgi:enoyl-CoA hydratase/carnithine racemase
VNAVSHRIDVAWHSDAIAVLTFYDAARGNQLCWAAVDELATSLRRCREEGARVLILASSLAGHWLEHAWLQDLMSGIDGGEQTGTGSGWFHAQEELTREEVVSIAAISGDCSGGGAELGWACDLRVAEEQARFSQPESALGLTTGIGGCSRLAHLAGRAVAADMVLTGRPLSAARLYALGALSRVVAKGEALPAALHLARQFAAKSPEALAGLKRILAGTEQRSLPDALVYEQQVFQSVVFTARARTAMRDAQERYDAGATTAEVAGYDEWNGW